MRMNMSIGLPGKVEPMSTLFGKEEQPPTKAKDWRLDNSRKGGEM